MKTPEEYLATLRGLEYWCVFSFDDDVELPDFDEVSEALKWAIAELEKGERDGEG